ncbi:MAG: DNA-binding protein [Dehalococcoidia bacterium]|nr:DNA-binding protein [Dehalococcoidia bacterium]
MIQPLSDDYVGATQAAAILGISRVTLHRWVKQGVVRAYTLGPRRVLIKRTDLD